ncbi:MAG: hypothetical protein Q8891_04590 [Bacteroidota bacterium]|nr:hypothetical protein [Bacteroidota bacterium]
MFEGREVVIATRRHQKEKVIASLSPPWSSFSSKFKALQRQKRGSRCCGRADGFAALQ